MLFQLILFLSLQFTFSQDQGADTKADYVKSIDMMAILQLFTSIEGDASQPESFREKVAALKKKETWVQVKNNLNLLRVGVDSYRVYKMNTTGDENTKNQDKVEHIKNLAVILPLTHGIETVAGEVSMLIAANMGASIGNIATLGVVGAIIKIPLLVDPICILFITAYKYSPHFRSGITFIRDSTTLGFSFLASQTGLKQLWSKYFYNMSVIEQLYQLQEKGWKLRTSDRLLIKKQGLEIEVANIEGNYFVKSVVAENFDKRILRDLPFNVRYALRRVIVNNKHDFYVDGVESIDSDKRGFTFKNFSLPLSGKSYRKNQCYHLFDT